MNDPQIITQFSGSAWEDTCILSYGLTEEALLEPSFKPGTIQSVTANGVVVENADSLNGSQELRVYVGDDGGDDVRLFFNDVEYTPLFRGDGYLGYILGDNGMCKLYSGESLYMSFTVSGITAPDFLPTNILCYLSSDRSLPSNSRGEPEYINGYCINYPHKPTQDFPRFLLRFRQSVTELDLDQIVLHNCTKLASGNDGDTYKALLLDVVNFDEPAYCTYNDFIIAVFNYTN